MSTPLLPSFAPADMLRFAASLAPEALQALVAWLKGDTEEAPESLAVLPETLKSELSLAAMQARAAKG